MAKMIARGGEKENHHDEHRNDGPGQLHLHAAVDLRRLVFGVGPARPELDDDKNEQAGDHGEDGAGNQEHEEREAIDLMRGRGRGRQNAGRGLGALRQSRHGAKAK